MEAIVREFLAELTTAPSLVVPDCEAVADGSRPCHVYCDACIDGFCDTLMDTHANSTEVQEHIMALHDLPQAFKGF